MSRVVFDEPERVAHWVASQWGSDTPNHCEAIGFERDGWLVAGVYFDGKSSNNVFAHIASTARVIPANLLAAVGAYAFKQLGVERMTFLIEEHNTKCIDLVVGMGAELEGRLERALKDGDVLVYRLWDTCPFWKTLCDAGLA